MRALLFHCRTYNIKIDRLANRPKDITPEEIKEKEQECRRCIVVLVTIEKEDKIKESTTKLAREIKKMSREMKEKTIVLLPFAHLSNSLSKAKEGIEAMNLLEKKLRRKSRILRGHFGSHKSLLLDIYGHPGNARYREFY